MYDVGIPVLYFACSLYSKTKDIFQASHLGAKRFKKSLETYDLEYFVNLFPLDSD